MGVIMNDKDINELLNYINKSNNFKCDKYNNTIEIFYNHKHLLYIHITLILQILYTFNNKNNNDNRVNILFNKNKILILYHNISQYMYIKDV